MRLAADIIDRPLPYAGREPIARALAADPALRSLPSDVLARRFGVPRMVAETSVRLLARAFVGDPGAIVGRSFDEVISDAGEARREATSPAPMQEAAGYNAGATAIERFQSRQRMMRPPPGRASFAYRGAMGYQTPPIPDLATVLLSDAFPVTKRTWTDGDVPTDDEVRILNWQHPLVTQATSAQSLATLKAISGGARSWSQQAIVSGNTLSPRSSQEQAQWWLELQQIMRAVSTNQVVSEHDGSAIDLAGYGTFFGTWGLMPPKITSDQVQIQYWDLSDASHPRMKLVMWMTKKLLTLGSGESVIDATWARYGAHWEIYVDGDRVKMRTPEGPDAEKDFMKLFAGLGGTISALTTAISAAVAAYCPACSVAIKVAGNLAAKTANNAVTTKALASYGDQMLTDASVKAMRGDASSINALRSFSASLIGLAAGAQAGAQPNGGLVWDYLATLGTAYGNVPSALYAFAIDHTNTIQNAAGLAKVAQVPLEDAQYAVAAMTDTLTRFASNVSTIYLSPEETFLQRALHEHAASRDSLQTKNILQKLPNVPMGKNTPPSGAAPVVAGAAILGALWYAGLLKGLI